MILSFSTSPSLNYVAGMRDALVRELADMDEALEALLDADEGAEVDELGDRPLDHVTDGVLGHRLLPRVRLQSSDRQADAPALVVDVDYLGLDLFADGVGGLRVVDLVPGELALVDQAIDAAQVDEHADGCDAAHHAGHALADLKAAEQLVALLASLLIEGDLLRQDQAVGLAVDLQDLESQAFQMVRHQLENNMELMRELWTCRTPQDCAAIQTDMMRENVETALESSRRIADLLRKMADEAGKQIKQSMEETRRTA